VVYQLSISVIDNYIDTPCALIVARPFVFIDRSSDRLAQARRVLATRDQSIFAYDARFMLFCLPIYYLSILAVFTGLDYSPINVTWLYPLDFVYILCLLLIIIFVLCDCYI
jgi:hypothetical protein